MRFRISSFRSLFGFNRIVICSDLYSDFSTILVINFLLIGFLCKFVCCAEFVNNLIYLLLETHKGDSDDKNSYQHLHIHILVFFINFDLICDTDCILNYRFGKDISRNDHPLCDLHFDSVVRIPKE